MNFLVQHSELRDLYEKVAAGERISEADALRLFETKDLNALGAIADLVAPAQGRQSRQLHHQPLHQLFQLLHPELPVLLLRRKRTRCRRLPAFTSRKSSQKAREALEHRHHGIAHRRRTASLAAVQLLHRHVARAARRWTPRLQLKCFTAIEILHLAWLAKKTVPETLAELKAAGLDSLTGGGAEIFRKEVRSAIAKGKESAEEYLDVHRTWHRMGGRSTCTMLFGHVESLADRVDHLRQLRALQDETRGFTGFVPLPYQPENNDIPVKTPPTGFDTLRTLAVSRIYLDNFDHITAYWVGMGLKLAQVALSYGADDLHGTIIEEHIFHMAGATSPQQQTEAALVKAIREAGRTPVQRNTFYEPIKVWDAPPAASESETPGGKSKNAG